MKFDPKDKNHCFILNVKVRGVWLAKPNLELWTPTIYTDEDKETIRKEMEKNWIEIDVSKLKINKNNGDMEDDLENWDAETKSKARYN